MVIVFEFEDEAEARLAIAALHNESLATSALRLGRAAQYTALADRLERQLFDLHPLHRRASSFLHRLRDAFRRGTPAIEGGTLDDLADSIEARP